MAVPTDVNVALAFLPRVVIAPMQTTIIKANITAYSTAVGPSSAFKKSATEQAKRDNMTGSPSWLRNARKQRSTCDSFVQMGQAKSRSYAWFVKCPQARAGWQGTPRRRSLQPSVFGGLRPLR